MNRHILLEDREVVDAPTIAKAALYCYDCEHSLLLPKVHRESVEEAAKLGRERGSDAFSKAMMSAYREDPAQKFAITAFLLCHQGHCISPAMIVETVAGGSA